MKAKFIFASLAVALALPSGAAIGCQYSAVGQSQQRTISYQYDSAGKLTQEHIQQTQPTTQTLTTAYQYDKVGNRTARTVTGAIQQTTTYQYDQNDRLTQSSDSHEGTTSYRYDLRGNLTEKANGANKTTYSYNSDNRLIKVEHSNSGTITKTTTYGYDPQGRRIKKLVQQPNQSKTETHYTLDTERPYHEIAVEWTSHNNGPWVYKTYLHTPDGIGQLISQSEGTTTKQIYADAQGSTRLITDSATGASQSYSFDAFGNWLAGDVINNSNAPTHLYTGERFDADTGLIYLRARDYDPAIGRFISMDEHPGNQRIPLTLNKYLYANADPVNHVDPSGYMGLASVSISANMSSTFRTTSFASANRVVRKILFGHPPKDIGVVGELVLEWALQGFFDHIYDSGITKQEFGRRVHRELKEKCLGYTALPADVTLLCEPFFTNKGMTSNNSNPKGSVGIDVVILYKGKPIIAFELKTGKGMTLDGKSKRRRWSGATLIEITLHPTRK